MILRPHSYRSLAAVAAVDCATSSDAMYSRPYFRGEWRGYSSDRPLGPVSGDHAELVCGDSHYRAVREANRGFRPNYNAVPPPPQYGVVQQFHGPQFQPNRASAPVSQQHPPGPYRYPRPVGPAFGSYQTQYRPRASKPPDYRDWEYGKPGLPSHCERFSVLSYNILADYLATDHYQKLYFHIPRYIMDWNWRKRNIMFELGLWSADILCFQEVDRFQDLEAELKLRGYAGIWKMRTGDPADGCAIFWRILRFKLLHEESIEYNRIGLRDNVAQICVFESMNVQNNNSKGASILSPSGDSSARPNRVVICNIHVLFNPKRGDMKLGQMRLLLERAHAVSKLWDDAPVVLCGDFNCTPKSPIYNFITEQKLDISELARDKVSGQASAELRPSRPAYPDFRTQAADNSTQASSVNCEKNEQTHSPSSNAQNLACPQSPTNASATEMPENHASDLTNISDPCKIRTQAADNSTQASSVNCEKNEQTHSPSSNAQNLACPQSPTNASATEMLENHASDLTNISNPTLTSNSDTSSGTDLVLDEIFDLLSLEESVGEPTDKTSKNCDSILSKLHSTGQSPLQFDEHGNSLYNPSSWTPAEIETATGSADKTIVEHSLKLTSAYSDVENSSGIRDSSGEPFITSYHRRFLGTVDYIWHTEGLQTVKTLAPIPKHVMQQTRGFPTKKWGSDHIALVSEFGFTEDISSRNNAS